MINLKEKKILQFLNKKIKSRQFKILAGVLVLLSFIAFIIIKNLKPDTSLKLSSAPKSSNYLYQSKSKGFAIYLGSRSNKKSPEIKFAVENSSIDFKPEGDIHDQARLTNQDEKSLIYKNVYPDIDLIYTPIDKGVKEEIIIHNQQAALNNSQFTFKLNLENAVPQKDLMNDSAVTFVDSVSGDYLFHFVKPFMIDAGGNRSDNVMLKIQPNNSSSQIIIIPDQNWLKTALYPVVIDPTVTIDNADTVANWTSSDDTNFTKSQDTDDKKEGTGSIKVVASSDELSALPQSGNAQGYWKLEETSGTRYDETGNDNDLTEVNTVGYAAGKIGDAADFERTNDEYLYIADDDQTGLDITGEITISAWIKREEANRVHQICEKSNEDNNERSYMFFINADNELIFRVSTDGKSGTNVSAESAGTIASGSWAHVAATHNQSTDELQVYINGSANGSAVPFSDNLHDSTARFNIGARHDGPMEYHFDGLIDEVIIWNTSLTADEIQQVYEITGTCLNDTVTRDLGEGNEKDLSGYDEVKYWINSTRTGTYLQFGLGETSWDNNTSNITINSADTWEEKTIDISGISSSNKDAIRYLGFKVTNADTDFTMKFDDIRAYLSNSSPTAPTSLLTEGQTNPSGIDDTTPEFSAVYNDADSGDIANKYRIQVDDDSGFGSTIWDSGSSGTAMTNCSDEGNRCSNISYGGSTLTRGTTYYWRIKFWDDGGLEGAWSTETAYFTMLPIYEPTACLIDDSGQSSQLIVKWADNTDLETGYEIQRSVDGAAFSTFTTKAANSTSSTDDTTVADHTYSYRVRAVSDNGNSVWCESQPVNYGKDTVYFKGTKMQGLTIR